ncbi:hypothetical protein BSKO_08579 [Bryopsis sp. KO-2023]|nr:hypothetical protein BSKO_08579 [Bryopsis sp. KO-2023]
MKRSLPDQPVKLHLFGPDGVEHPLGERRLFGRGCGFSGDEHVSRRQFAVSAVDEVEGVGRLENLGMNPMAIEVSEGNEWRTIDILESGQETILNASMRFYVLHKMQETLFQVKEAEHDIGNTSDVPSHAASKQKTTKEEIDLTSSNDANPTNYPPQPSNNETPGNRTEQTSPSVGFSLLWVRGLAERVNSGAFGVKLRHLMSGGSMNVAFVSNFMIDFPSLLSACPELSSVKKMIVVHGEKGVSAVNIRRAAETVGYQDLVVHGPPLPVSYGTHHTKAFIIGFETGVRVVVHTANLIYADCNSKTQGVWWQDFPKKKPDGRENSEFGLDLLGYLTALKLPRQANEIMTNLVNAHDFSSARVKLVASVPGYHKGEDLERYGHMRLRQILRSERFDSKFHRAPVICQFSSMGSLDAKWVTQEFHSSVGCGKSVAGGELQMPPKDAAGMQIVWPRVSEVRESIEGWAAGYSIPGYVKNVAKPFLRPFFHRYGGSPAGRQRAMPHIKTFVRYSGNELAWVLLTSHNLSKAAWGTLQKNNTQLMIRSYEMGVLFVPSAEQAYRTSPHRDFSCTPSISNSGYLGSQSMPMQAKEEKDQLDACGGPSNRVDSGSGSESIQMAQYVAIRSDRKNPGSDVGHAAVLGFPLPYSLPPELYDEHDRPWMVDQPVEGVDSLGRAWGVPVSFYGHKQDG